MFGSLPVLTHYSILSRRSCHHQVSVGHHWLDGSSIPSITPTFVGLPCTPMSDSVADSDQMLKKRSNQPLIGQTSESLPSQLSSSSSPSDFGSGTGDANTDVHQTSNVTSTSSVPRRPQISELMAHVSTTQTRNEQHPAQSMGSPPRKRRCVSASPIVLARTRWTSPDRFIPSRPNHDKATPFLTSKPPSSLHRRELYGRARDPAADPFRSQTESRSQETANRRTPSTAYGLHPPRYMPSFVHGVDAGPVNIDPRRGPDALRHTSWGGFWTVGGASAAQFGQLRGVPTGSGQRIASGTNAPMHTPAFLDAPTHADLRSAHENRLALALEIDQAARILSPSRGTSHTSGTPAAHDQAVRWRDCAWGRHHAHKGILLSAMIGIMLTCGSTASEKYGNPQD